MKILITGGNGFIGRHLVRRLAPNHQITVLDHSIPTEMPVGVYYVREDIQSYKPRYEYGFVYHLAGVSRVAPSYNDPEETVDTNVAGTLNLLRYKGNAPFIFVSTLNRGSSPYSVSKMATEQLVYDAGVDTICLPSVYGAGGQGVLDKWLEGTTGPIYRTADPSTRVNLISIQDVVATLESFLTKRPHQQVTVISGETYTLGELAALIGRECLSKEYTPGTYSVPNITSDYPTGRRTVKEYIEERLYGR